jgi:hypothetical protein
MTHTIRYFKDGRPTGDEHWTGIFGEARALAENAVHTAAAERVEVIDDDGNIAFQHPTQGTS